MPAVEILEITPSAVRRTDEPVDRTLFESSLVQVGKFRCGVDHRRFVDTDATQQYCFVFPRSAVWIQHDGAPPFVADANVIPLYNPGRPYRRRPISPAGDRTDWFAVAPEIIREIVAESDPGAADSDQLFRPGMVRSDASTFLFQRQVFNHIVRSPAPDALFVEESVVRMLSGVISSVYGRRQTTPLPRRALDLVEHAREEINGRFMRNGGLGDLATQVDASVFHLCRIFARTTGQTIHRYRTHLRLRRSLELLDSGDGDILSTALDLGFSSHSHFTGAFHRMFGVTPSAYKRRTRQRAFL